MTSAAALFASLAIGLSPQIPHRDGLVRVKVTGLNAPKAQIQIAGGLASGGHWFGWIPLQGGAGGSWSALLRAPGFLGVYPVQVKSRGKVGESGLLIKLLPRGFARQPGFFTPRELADWWAERLPAGSRVLSATVWNSGFFTHRDKRFNLLLRTRVQYGETSNRVFYVSMARLRDGGPWRWLETTTAP